jgi:hypothetical protein
MMTVNHEIMYRFEWTADGGQSMSKDLEQMEDQGELFDESPTGTLSPVEHSKPTVTVLLAQLGVQPHVEGNLFMQELDWPCPLGARRPRDPTIVDKEEEDCTSCRMGKQCTCISQLPRIRHRIAIGPRDHRVVIASLPEKANSAVSESDSYFGELVGDLHSPIHDCEGIFFELPRPGPSCTSHLH